MVIFKTDCGAVDLHQCDSDLHPHAQQCGANVVKFDPGADRVLAGADVLQQEVAAGDFNVVQQLEDAMTERRSAMRGTPVSNPAPTVPATAR